MANTSKLLANALKNSTKLSSQIAYLRAVFNDGKKEETSLNDEAFKAVIGNLPGAADDAKVLASRIDALMKMETPEEILRAAKPSPVSAMKDTSSQFTLAKLVGEALDKAFLTELAEDTEAYKKGKEGGYHAFLGMLRLFGPSAENNFKNMLDTFPIVDSEKGDVDKVNVQFVSRFPSDMPAKYKVENVTTGKKEDRDFFFLMYDDSADGIRVNEIIRQCDLAAANSIDAIEPYKSMSDLERQSKRADAVQTKNYGRKCLKDAAALHQQIAACNKLADVIVKLRFNSDGTLVRPNPIHLRDTKTEDFRQVGMNILKSYRPHLAKGGSLKDLLSTRPTRQGSSGQGEVEKKVAMPTAPKNAEEIAAMLFHYWDIAENISATLRYGKENYALKDTVVGLYTVLGPLYRAWHEEVDKHNQQEAAKDTKTPAIKAAEEALRKAQQG